MQIGLMRLLYLFNFIFDVLTSESDGKLGEAAAAALMDPVLLAHRATHQVLPEKKTFNRRPATPGPGVVRLSPLTLANPNVSKKEANTKRRGRAVTLHDNPVVITPEPCGRLKPLSKQAAPRKSSWGSSKSSSPIESDEFFDEIEAAIKESNQDACSYMAARPEMKSLSTDELLDLLQVAHRRSFISWNSKEIFQELFADVVLRIVPENHPQSFKKFIMLAVQHTVPLALFSSACKHINLLSSQDLSDLIHEIELKFVWQRIERTGKADLKRFNSMIMEIAINMKNCESILELDYIKDVFSLSMESSAGFAFTLALSKIKMIYMTVHMLAGLKDVNSSDSERDLKEALSAMFQYGKIELGLDTEIICSYIDSVWKVFLLFAKPEQSESLGKVLKTLHEIIMQQVDIPYIPKKMDGVEDLYIYFQQNMINLSKARLKFYRFSKITKYQLLSLLNSAEFSDAPDSSEFMLAILGSIIVPQQAISEEDLLSTLTRPKILLKGSFTIPRKYSGDICTSNINFKQAETMIWNLPADLFVPDEPANPEEIFSLTEILYELPRLFLFRVFGIPMNESFKASLGTSELPESQELIDIANFFLERWCATNSGREIYPIIKIVSAEKAKV